MPSSCIAGRSFHSPPSLSEIVQEIVQVSRVPFCVMEIGIKGREEVLESNCHFVVLLLVFQFPKQGKSSCSGCLYSVVSNTAFSITLFLFFFSIVHLPC